MAPDRSISFDPSLLRAAERRVAETGGSLDDLVGVALRRELGATGEAAAAGAEEQPLAERCAAYLAALLDRDSRSAREVVEAAVDAGIPVLDIYTGVFQPALREIGHLWAMETINVAQEHFATSVTQSLLATLAPRERFVADQGRLAVVTSTPDELHGLGAQMVADLLARDGWEVLGLGAATPATDLAELVERECPELVALSATTAGRLPGVSEVLRALGEVQPRPFVVVGGSLFTDEASAVAEDLGADLVVSDLRDFMREMRARFGAPAVIRPRGAG